MTQLRDQEQGCPWDKKQTNQSIAPFTIEEAYEVVDAINKNDPEKLKEELGDLLFQIIFLSEIASEKNQFKFNDVVEGITDKMTRRHPHVINPEINENNDDRNSSWENLKKIERKNRALSRGEDFTTLSDVPDALPALTRSIKLQKRASKEGFDWTNVIGSLEKLKEEVSEFIDEIKSPLKKDHNLFASDEFGDILFSWVNVARHHNIDPENALRMTNNKFVRRFNFIESMLKTMNISIESATLDQMESLWNLAKDDEK